jgi:hypothetical protein
LFAQISKLNCDLAPNLIVSGRRDVDATGFGDTLKSGSHIDTVTENVVTLNQNITEVDPDPQEHSLVLCDTFVSLGHHSLHGQGALDGIDHRVKFKQQAVSRSFDDSTGMPGHESIDCSAVITEGTGGADLVEAHEPRKASHVGGQYCRQPASDPLWRLLHHWHAIPVYGTFYDKSDRCANLLGCRLLALNGHLSPPAGCLL